MIARWTSIDPHAESYQDKSTYDYAVNNPVSIGDFDGRDTIHARVVYIVDTKPKPKPQVPPEEPIEPYKPIEPIPPAGGIKPPSFLMPVLTLLFVLMPANYGHSEAADHLKEFGYRKRGWYRDKHGNLTNGKYTVNKETMKKHVVGGVEGRSMFYPGIDADEAVLSAAEYADKNNLWDATGEKAKVPVTNSHIGTTGLKQSTNIINVYKNARGMIHGSPGN